MQSVRGMSVFKIKRSGSRWWWNKGVDAFSKLTSSNLPLKYGMSGTCMREPTAVGRVLLLKYKCLLPGWRALYIWIFSNSGKGNVVAPKWQHNISLTNWLLRRHCYSASHFSNLWLLHIERQSLQQTVTIELSNTLRKNKNALTQSKEW